MAARLKEYYKKTVAPALMKEFGYTNIMAVPKLEKISVNIGLGEATQNPKLLDGAVTKRKDTALRLAGNESRAADVILQRIRQHYGTLLTRQVSHLASGNPRWHWEFHRAVSGIADASIDPDVVLDADKDGNVRGVARAFLPPSVPSAERAWLGAVDAIVRAAKRTIPHQDSFSPTLRVTEPIRFSGSNRIVCVARITQTPEFQRYLRSGFQSDRRFTGPSTLVQVYYGKPPDDMLKQVAERKGEYRVEYARSLSEGAVRLRVSSLTEAAEAVRRFTLRKWAAARYVLEWDDGSTTVLDAPRALRMAGLDPDEHIPPTVRDLDEADASALPPDDGTQWRDATGDVVAGDVIRFREAVFKGSFRSPKFVGERTITARVEKESYGADKQQHTFSLRVISSDGIDPLKAGERTRRKGRNIYRNGTERLVWRDEEARRAVADEKHRRGDAARQVRRWRIGESDGLATAFDAPRRSWPGTYLDIGHGDSPVTLWWVDRQWGWHTRSLRFGGEAYHLDPSLASGRATERVVSVSPHPRLAGSPLDRVLEMVRRRFPGRLIVLFTHYGARGEIVDEAVLASPSGPSQS